MGLTQDQKYARNIRAYQRLKGLYDRSLAERAHLRDLVHDLKIEVRELRRTRKQYENASRNTMSRLFASVQFAIARLVDAGDREGAERLSTWLDEMREVMQPVANVRELTALLEEWADAMPCDDPDAVAALYMKTRMMLDDLAGREHA